MYVRNCKNQINDGTQCSLNTIVLVLCFLFGDRCGTAASFGAFIMSLILGRAVSGWLSSCF